MIGLLSLKDNKKKPQVILLVVDGLRGDVLFDEYNKDTFNGAFSKFIDKGLVFETTFSNGCPTQTSMNSLLTSSYPLDEGGYDFGLLTRKKHQSFVSELQKHGVQTFGLASCPWNSSFFGFDHGYDCHHDFFNSLALIDPVLNSIYSPNSILCKEFTGLKLYIAKLQQFFDRQMKVFIANRRGDSASSYCSTRSFKKINRLVSFIEGGRFFRFDDRLIKLRALTFLKKVINKFFLIIGFPYKFFVSENIFLLRDIKKHFFDEIISFCSVGKSFASLHIMDLHDLYRGKVFSKNVDSDKAYRSSLKYLDAELDGLIERFSKEMENPVFILCGDHGSYNAQPNRGVASQNNYDSVYRENITTFLGFYGPSIKPSMRKNVVSLLDLGPTICGLFDIKHPNSKGRDLFDNKASEFGYSIAETIGPGPCFVDSRPITISVTDSNSQLILREYLTKYNRLTDKIVEFSTSETEHVNKIFVDFYSVAMNRLIEVRGKN